MVPKEDKYYATKTEMKEQIIHLLGGRVAEQLVLHDISTGASMTLERATNIARGMVTKYGMSENSGPINYSGEDEIFGRDFSTRRNYSEEIASKIDKEVRLIVEEGYRTAENCLRKI